MCYCSEYYKIVLIVCVFINFYILKCFNDVPAQMPVFNDLINRTGTIAVFRTSISYY